jgi:hypothetical protein
MVCAETPPAVTNAVVSVSIERSFFIVPPVEIVP